MAIDNLKKHLILSLLRFFTAFWLYLYIIAREKKGCPAAPLFFPSIFCCSQSSNNPQEDLARFDYKMYQNYRSMF
jgi:hypothetical protein